MSNLKAVVDLIKSGKSKERQQGIASIREVFSRSSVVENLDVKGDGRAWLAVFQALFTAAVNERDAVVKNTSSTTAVAEKRLKDVASALRWLTERSVTKWPTKVAKPLVKHLLQSMVNGGNLFAPVALDYVKALRVICSYTPHLDHIMAEEAQWIKILMLSFAVLLDDDLRTGLEDEQDGMSEVEVNLALSTNEGPSSRKRKARDASGKSAARGAHRTASPEQIEFVALISILLQSPRLKIISSDHPRLPGVILEKLSQFFRIYHVETSAHLDAIRAVQGTLDSVSLNMRDEVIEFGVTMWDSLLQLWSSKSRPMKESVLMVLKLLFPYVTHSEAQLDRVDGIGKLLRYLQADHETRWSFDELNLDSLRLEIISDKIDEPFVAQTFRAGFNFSAGQAIAWAVLELLADATKELYSLSESNHSSTSGPGRPNSKRARLENPIKSILSSIQNPRVTRGKVFSLQSLLFIIDRHWSVIHLEMQLEIFNTLSQLISTDDANVQSWVFCCFAAIACADRSPQSPAHGTIQWDGIWSHTMRRTNAPIISRTACHAANALLLCEKLPASRILAEIETMAQDINVQGPSAPYDSVCAFLARCVKIASQDARLHRMHLDDKVLSWLIENWNILNGITTSLSQVRLEQHTVQDILTLLSGACGLSKSSQLLCPIQLPQHPIVDLIQCQIDTSIIRDFLLNARLPDTASKPSSDFTDLSKDRLTHPTTDLTQPDARARKTSAYFLKTLESVIPFWDSNVDSSLRPAAESVRRTLDLAVLAVCFESSLVMSGICNNRRSLLTACKLITLIAPHLLDFGWSSEELAILLSSFAPLTSDCSEIELEKKRGALISPGKATGVRGASSKYRMYGSHRISLQTSRRCLQRIIWQSSDVQDALAAVLESLKKTLKVHAADQHQALDQLTPLVDDDKDGFGPIRTTNTPVIDANRAVDDRSAAKSIVCTCIDTIALAPVLQFSEGEVTRDRSLIDIVCGCDNDDTFQVVLEPFLRHVQQQNIGLTIANLDKLLTRIERPMMSYRYGRSDALHIAAIHLLDATLPVWLQKLPSSAATSDMVVTIVVWLVTNLREGQLLCWRTRDALTLFLDHYITHDPTQDFLREQKKKNGKDLFEPDDLPDALLLSLTKDEDIRVRTVAASSCAHLFSNAYIYTRDPMLVYTNIREQLCIDLSNYEHMLTRFICLANILISSSAVRRGPYWHLLETCLHTQLYVKHIESVLSIAAKEMGLSHFSELFEAYASQIAYSIRVSQQDFFRFPPHLLGYHDRRECAEATFVAFSPANLLASPHDVDELAHGHGAFARHCLMINQKTADGLLKCFADIVGYQIVFWMDDHQNSDLDAMDADNRDISMDVSGLLDVLQEKFKSLGSGEFLQSLIEQNMDGIVCAILRTSGDLDYHKDGAIVRALEGLYRSERSVRAFRALMKYRGQGEFEMHSPNLPSFSTSVVLSALGWLASRVDTANSSSTTYHVMQYFFSEVASSPLINEQLRLLTCLCIWISLEYVHFKNPTLLRVLMSGAAALLAQPDLSMMAQGMLDWAFIHLCETQSDVPHVIEVLIRISTISREFMCSADEIIKGMGIRMKEWIETQMTMLGEVTSLRKYIAIALAAWPDELGDRLADMRGELNSEDLSTILDDPYLTSHKFKIARRLAALASNGDVEEERFAKHDFWRLKDCIPSSNLRGEEVDAFTTLLITNSGHVRSQAIDHAYGRSIGSRHLRLLMKRDDKGRRNANVSIKRPVVNALLDMLTDQSAKVVHVAYKTLRLLAGIDLLDSADYGSWPSEYRGDITFLNFCPTKKNIASPQTLTDLLQPRLLDAASDYTAWISEVTLFLSGVLIGRDPFYAHLSNALCNNSEFAEQMFPVLVHTLLSHDQKQAGSEPRIILSDYFSKLLVQVGLDVRCHRSIINLVLHLRNFDPRNSQDVLAYNRWLNLNFMLLSRSATKCGAYTTALLFLELAVESRQIQEDDNNSSEQVLFDIYSHIDEPDGFYGIKAHDLQDFLLRRFHHERQWEKTFQFQGAGLESGDKGLKGYTGILESLHSFGFNNLAMSTLQSMGDNSSNSLSSDMEYRLGWRTGTWDLPDPVNCESSSCTLYVALRAIHRERDPEVIDNIVSKSLTDELQRLRDLGNENLAEIRQVTQSLMCLAQIKRWRSNFIQDSLSESSIDTNERLWVDFCSIQGQFDFPDLENMIATRISLLRSARQRDQREQIGTMQSNLTRALIQLEKNSLVQLTEAAREANQPQIALNSVVCALQLEDRPAFEVRREFANVLWLQREQKFAVEYLKGEMEKRRRIRPHVSNNVQDALTLAKLGEWISEACLEKPDFIHKKFFAPAIDLLLGGNYDNDSSKDARADVFYKCALFAEQQYYAIVQSPDIIRLKVYAERKKKELREREETIRKTASSSATWKELTQHQRRAQALFEQDTAQFIEVTSAREKYLNQAIHLLSLCLEASDSYDVDAAIRMCSLWFANFATDLLSSAIPTAVDKVPSRKFVFLAHQLSARLSALDSSRSSNQNVLQSLLLRMCSEHPFHSLYQVYSLQSSNTNAGSSNRGVIEPDSHSQIDRSTAASNIFDRLGIVSKCADKARDVRLLCDAYLEWAKYSIKKNPIFTERKRKKEPVQIPKDLTIRNISNLRVPVTTADTPLDPSMRYEECVWIQGYAPHFETAGGINLPKISYCLGSDGTRYKQLFKGEGDDDLRQDAVMEQVFELCNQVLCRDRETRKRQLSIRSYKVVPLAPQAGLLEFVGNTTPMQGWLALSHARYNPTDLAFKECTNQLSTLRRETDRVKDKTVQKDALVDLFKNIRQNFRPVMRHFFTERHKVPQSWFEMRLRYSRSVAVASIVGHVLGLGDRHICNILLDTVSGEVVHIDLGIAFEQGKLLPIPERVPFRLTADIVDGFGMSGTEGVFRRCSEETLRVLRDGSDVIKTVLEVFKYDPLHSWTASAVKIRKAQADSVHLPTHESDRLGIGIDMSSGMEDEAADRALNGVASKLDKSLSIEYTVNELIAEATDITNLALMFAGWSPFC